MAYSTIDKPSKYFNTIIWTGNNTGSTRSFTGVGFKPDFIWAKRRGTSGSHQVYDIIRGTSNALQTDSTSSQFTSNVYGMITSIDTDGYTWTNGSDGVNPRYYFNESDNYVGWNWLASNTTASNTSGTITSTVSANTTSGFSIVSYTGTGASATVGHGLGVAPKMIIVKRRSNTGEWIVYSSSLGSSYGLKLNTTGAQFSADATVWNSTNPTSSVFSIGSAVDLNASSNTYIAYCFAEVKGFSKFGSYKGNGNADGTFVYTGFKPAWVMVKGSSFAGDNWNIRDNQRTPINPANKNLLANDSRAEEPYYATDLLSNGFKARTSEAGHNSSGETYIYMAFAENPFVSSKGLPTTAR